MRNLWRIGAEPTWWPGRTGAKRGVVGKTCDMGHFFIFFPFLESGPLPANLENARIAWHRMASLCQILQEHWSSWLCLQMELP